LFGPLSYSPEALELLQLKFEKERRAMRINDAPSLDHYYSRQDMHVPKLAVAIHFSKTTSNMEISVEDAQEAIDLLHKLEVNMHKALQLVGKNPLSGTAKRITGLLARVGPQTDKQIWFYFEADLRWTELQETLDMLVATGRVRKVTEAAEDKYTLPIVKP
jgi:hypothetical protein